MNYAAPEARHGRARLRADVKMSVLRLHPTAEPAGACTLTALARHRHRVYDGPE